MSKYVVYEGLDNFAVFREFDNFLITSSIENYIKSIDSDFAANPGGWVEINAEDYFNLLNVFKYPEPWTWTDIASIYNPVSIQTTSFAKTIAVDFEYNLNLSLPLKKETITYDTGLQINKYNFLKNFHDISINKGTCFVLTSALTLKDIFSEPKNVSFGQLPGTFKLSPRNSSIYSVSYNNMQKLFTLSLTGDVFHISPIQNSNEVELLVNNKFVQVEKDYPYNIVLNDFSLKGNELYRQRFVCNANNGLITIKTLTDTGYRYLTLTTNNILRCTGLMFNESIVHDYVFNYELITLSSLEIDFDLKNHWITYYNDYEIGTENTTVTINKNFTDIPINYLISFSIENAIKTGKAIVNISNLKTLLTPSGAAASTDNQYSKALPT